MGVRGLQKGLSGKEVRFNTTHSCTCLSQSLSAQFQDIRAAKSLPPQAGVVKIDEAPRKYFAASFPAWHMCSSCLPCTRLGKLGQRRDFRCAGRPHAPPGGTRLDRLRLCCRLSKCTIASKVIMTCLFET